MHYSAQIHINHNKKFLVTNYWLLRVYETFLNLKLQRNILTAFALPPHCIARSWNHVQLVSSCVDRIKVTWTPSDLWTAEQSIHKNTPYVTLAHVGLLLPQSKHCWNIKENVITIKQCLCSKFDSDQINRYPVAYDMPLSVLPKAIESILVWWHFKLIQR